MDTIQHYRSMRLVTSFVVITLVLAPTVSMANCCCVLAKVGRAAGLPANSCCDRHAVAACCASSVGETVLAQRVCCAVRGDTESTNGLNSQRFASDQVESPKCDCERSCCDDASVLQVAITSDADSSRLGQDVAVESSDLFVSYDLIPASLRLGTDRSPCFLSAPHRCATLCRWLN